MAHFYIVDGDFLVSTGCAPDGMEPDGAIIGFPPQFTNPVPPHSGARWNVNKHCWQDCRTKEDQVQQAAMQVQARRYAEYPPLADFADAMYWDSRGNPSKLTDYFNKCEAVKAKHPKPNR